MTFTIKLSDVGSRNISYPVLDFRFWQEADARSLMLKIAFPRQSLLCGVPVTWNNLSAAMSGHKKSETIRQFTAHIIWRRGGENVGQTSDHCDHRFLRCGHDDRDDDLSADLSPRGY